MSEACHRCGLRFERIEGHWVGAIGINTIATFGILLGSLIAGLIFTFPDFPVVPLMIGNVLLALCAPVVLFPVSRMVWTAIDVALRPLEAHEVDWTATGREN